MFIILNYNYNFKQTIFFFYNPNHWKLLCTLFMYWYAFKFWKLEDKKNSKFSTTVWKVNNMTLHLQTVWICSTYKHEDFFFLQTKIVLSTFVICVFTCKLYEVYNCLFRNFLTFSWISCVDCASQNATVATSLRMGISIEQSLPSRRAMSGRGCMGPLGIGPRMDTEKEKK